MTKTQAVREHLNKFGAITSWEAIENYGETRLADIIYRMRKFENIPIKKEMIKFSDRFGNVGKYARYVLVKHGDM